MDFVPHDQATIRAMLDAIGVPALDALYEDIPADLQVDGLGLEPGLNEPALRQHLEEIASKNRVHDCALLGAGTYYHYIPSLVDFVVSRSEFYTAYTPYQAEASQGFLQAIYEYQSAIGRLTAMDVSNASMYDGSTALAEAAVMATVITRRDKIVLVTGVHPEYVQVVETYCWGRGIEAVETPLERLGEVLGDDVAAVLVQSPNFFGEIEDVPAIVQQVRAAVPKGLIVQVMTDPTGLGVLKPPGTMDIDIFVAEGQALGLTPSFGGPSLGIFTTKKRYLRKIPGRLVGKTSEIAGDGTGFVLTLQAREQHIRREKALSNICTNQGLCMLAALVYLAALGETGLREVAVQNVRKAHYLRRGLARVPGFSIVSREPAYNEFVFQCDHPDALESALEDADILPPLRLSRYFPDRDDQFLACVTELNTKAQLDRVLEIAADLHTTGGAR